MISGADAFADWLRQHGVKPLTPDAGDSLHPLFTYTPLSLVDQTLIRLERNFGWMHGAVLIGVLNAMIRRGLIVQEGEHYGLAEHRAACGESWLIDAETRRQPQLRLAGGEDGNRPLG